MLAGATELTTPPAVSSPDGLTTLTLTTDIGAGAFTIIYTATPLAAGLELWCYGAILPHAGIKYVRNRLKFVAVSAAAQASPYNWEAAFYARCGTPTVGQIVVANVSVFDTATGLLSTPMQEMQAVVST
jgi:hypothetical protein